jgi:hypothetical protein
MPNHSTYLHFRLQMTPQETTVEEAEVKTHEAEKRMFIVSCMLSIL